MARKARGSYRRRKGGFGRYYRGRINHTLNLGTLAGGDMIATDLVNTVGERTRISSVDLVWSLDQYSPAQGDGPIIVGVAHSDYTTAEIEQWLESTGAWDAGDLVNQEESNRKCRMVGTMKTPANAAEIENLNDGKPIKTKLNWVLDTGQTLKIWAYNDGSSNLATTTPNVRCMGKANMWKQG